MDARYYAVATPPTARPPTGDELLLSTTTPPPASSTSHTLSTGLQASHSARSPRLSQSHASDATRDFHELREVALAAAAHKRRWTPLHSSDSGRSRRPRCVRALAVGASAVGVLAAGFALAFVLPQDLERLAVVVIGSLLSFVSALVVLVSYVFQPANRRHPNELLVYVALCEGGLALLALVHVMVYCASHTGDSVAYCTPLSMRACTVVSALEMFLLLASVGWFGAAILHLFVSVSNPFASYKAQLQVYHSVVWSGSIAVAVLVPLTVFRQSNQDKLDMSSVELCRAAMLVLPMLPAVATAHDQQLRVTQWRELNVAYWGALFALVVLLVVAAQAALVVGWWRSNSGTVIALKARRRLMKRMTIYVHALNATWLVIFIAFFTYRSSDSALQRLQSADQAFRVGDNDSDSVSGSATRDSLSGVHVLDGLFHYLLAAKGYVTCVVWVSVNKHCCACRSTLYGRANTTRRTPAAALTDGEDDDDDNDNDSETDRRENPLVWSSASLAMLENGGGGGATYGVSATSHRRSLTGADVRDTPSFLLPCSTQAPDSRLSRVSASSMSSWASQNNETLQREIIYYTVCGIAKSILKALATPSAATVVAQEMLVGAERDSAFAPNALLTHVQTIHALRSPRPFCEPSLVGVALPSLGRPRAPDDSCNNTEIATASVASSSTTTLGGSFSQRMSFLSTSSQHHVLSSSISFTHTPAPGRYSLYPVSQVPFELFDHEFEVQSNRSSSLGLSPLFAGLRRTAFGGPPPALVDTVAAGRRRTSSAGDIPKPKVFVDYAPSEFRAVRQAFGLSDETYLASFRTTAKERVSAGSSGAFMFFSGDNALIVKSMKEKECRKLVKMAPAYAAYIRAHPTSRIIRFFGCHRLRLYGRNFYFVVMSNVLHSVHHTPTITEKYDVKGSWVDRRARRPQMGDTVTCSDCDASYVFGHGDASTTFPFHVHRPDTILKDLDLQRKLYLPPRVADALHAQLVADCDFLNTMGIMDYSLLVGVHKCRRQVADTAVAIREDDDDNDTNDNDNVNDNVNDRSERQGADATNLAPLAAESDTEVYFVGIIDILQEWDWEKQMEKVGKMLLGKSGSGISAVPPDAYSQRFKARVAQILLGDGVVSDAASDSSTILSPNATTSHVLSP